MDGIISSPDYITNTEKSAQIELSKSEVPFGSMNVIIVLSIVGAAFAAAFAAGEEYNLRFVTFVHRHGDRSPVGTYPNDPYGQESRWNNGWGELTTAGKQRAFKLGKWLRERYGNFLPKIYSKTDYEVQSTDVRRTLMSAYLVLAGLYEPEGSDVWNSDIKWQPIPVHTTPAKLDNVLAGGKPCPRLTVLQLQLLMSEEFASILQPYADTISNVSRFAGYNSSGLLKDFLPVTMVYDTLNVQNENGLELPKWTAPYFPQPLRNLSSIMLRFDSFNRRLQRLSCGMLVKEILDNFKQKAKGELKQKIWQYSGHDVTIVKLRQCLGFRETDSPPYSSALLLELLSRGDSYFVKIFYKTGDDLRTMIMPGCSEYCPLEQFEELVTPIIPEDWEKECKLSFT